MFNQVTRKRSSYFVPAAIVLTLAGVIAAPMALAKIIANTIDPFATIAGGGRSY